MTYTYLVISCNSTICRVTAMCGILRSLTEDEAQASLSAGATGTGRIIRGSS